MMPRPSAPHVSLGLPPTLPTPRTESAAKNRHQLHLDPFIDKSNEKSYKRI